MNVPDTAKPLNYEAAERILETTKDPVLANVLRFALAQLQLQLLPTVDVSEEEWRRNLPQAPVDIAFFLRVVRGMFERRAILVELLAGRTTAEATGWDVE
jgi:hypothetical protein